MRAVSEANPSDLSRLYIITGEPSGDLHAAAVVRALKEQTPQIEVRAMGGDALAAEGAELVEHVRNTSIMGFAEVVRKLGFIRRLMDRVKQDILAFHPDRILLVDYPGFNLRLATWARLQGLAVDMYIAPQIWAWKRGRIHRMARDLDRLYVILPFEPDHYADVDLQVEYVGHPLADAIPAAAPRGRDGTEGAAWREKVGLPAEGEILALLPGSRPQEIERMLSCLTETAQHFPAFIPVVAGAPGRSASDYATDLPVLFGETQALYRFAAAGIVTSGTATLEAALHGLPQVVAYRTSQLTYTLARLFTRVRFISLVNLVLDREALPERIQGACTPVGLAHALEGVLSPEGRARLEQDQADLRGRLAKKGAAASVARNLLRED